MRDRGEMERFAEEREICGRYGPNFARNAMAVVERMRRALAMVVDKVCGGVGDRGSKSEQVLATWRKGRKDSVTHRDNDQHRSFFGD